MRTTESPMMAKAFLDPGDENRFRSEADTKAQLVRARSLPPGVESTIMVTDAEDWPNPRRPAIGARERLGIFDRPVNLRGDRRSEE